MKNKTYVNALEQEMTNFFFKGPHNILGFASHMVSVATAQLCYCSFNVATDNI